MIRRNKPVLSEQGMALPITLILMVCVTFIALSFAGLYSGRLSLNTLHITHYDAQYIAEAGLNKYLWILNNDPDGVNTFIQQQQFNSSSKTYTYFGYNQEANGYYDIVCTNPLANPISLNLTCTGWLASDPVHQYSFTATVETRSFTKYLYFTQRETDENGALVYWRPGDNLHGKLFTNDIIHTKDDSNETPPTPVFDDTVNCYDKWGSNYTSDITLDVADNGNPTWMKGEFQQGVLAPSYFPPQQASAQYSPPTANGIANLQTIAQSQNLAFSGRTCIYLTGNQMEVENFPNGSTTPVWNNGSASPITLPENAVVYVANASGTSDPGAIPENNTYNPTAKFNLNDGNVFVSGTLSGQLTIYAANNIYLTAGDPTNHLYGGSPPPPATINGNSNLAVYANTQFNTSNPASATAYGINGTNGTDMLGLIAYNYVMILRYGWPDDSAPNYYTNITDDYSPQSTTTANNVELEAAIMAINHSFLYEATWPPDLSSSYCSDNPSLYPILNITGAIIQNDRGAVAGDYNVELGCGYVKNYWYDSRMQAETPPYFLAPGNSGWGILSWGSIPPANITLTPAQGIAVQQNGDAVIQGEGLQLSATVTPASAAATLTWSFSQTGESTSDPTTGSTIDPYAGFLMAGSKATGSTPVKVYADAVDSSVQGTATITINP